MPNYKEEINHWRALLEQHRSNLRKQRQQQAVFARGEEPLALLNQIEKTEEAIREAKANLRQLSDQPEFSSIDPDEKLPPMFRENENQPNQLEPMLPDGTSISLPFAQSNPKGRSVPAETAQNFPLVFINYASENQNQARVLCTRLKDNGITPWFDKVDLLPGDDWELKIREVLQQADFIIVCLSKTSVTKKGYVQKEMKIALDIAQRMPEGAIFILPVRFETCDLPMGLGKYQYVDLFHPEGFDKLVRAIWIQWKKK